MAKLHTWVNGELVTADKLNDLEPEVPEGATEHFAQQVLPVVDGNLSAAAGEPITVTRQGVFVHVGGRFSASTANYMQSAYRDLAVVPVQYRPLGIEVAHLWGASMGMFICSPSDGVLRVRTSPQGSTHNANASFYLSITWVTAA